MDGEHGLWIGGEWRASAGELFFELRERWPRSGAADVRSGIEACAYAAARWSARSREDRRRVLVRAAEVLESDAGLPNDLATDLRMRAGEFDARHAQELFELREAIELLEGGENEQGVGFFQAHWSDLAAGLLMRVAPKLVAGQAVVVLGARELPLAAERVARALETADLPRGVVALLHDDGDGALGAAAASAGLAWLRLKGHAHRLATLRDRWRERVAPSWSWWAVRVRSHVVALGADPAAEAARVVEQAIGRSATLSAQFPGHVARGLCHQRLFSRFGDELLACLRTSPDSIDPVPAIEADLEAHVRGAWELGLDEGATPLAGWGQRAATDGAVEAAASWSGAWPALFTNVEARSRLAALDRPAPVLRLIRVSSDEAGRELARELDAPLRPTEP